MRFLSLNAITRRFKRGSIPRGEQGVVGFGTGEPNPTPFSDKEIQDTIDKDILKRFGTVSDNAIASLATQWISDQISAVPCEVVVRDDSNKFVRAEGHPLTDLLRWGSSFYDGRGLFSEIVTDLVSGNAYIFKARNGSDISELWWRPSERMFPISRGNTFLAYYEYQNGDVPVRINIEDLVHIKHRINKNDTRLGRPFYTPVFRELDADNETGRMLVEILRNSLMPNIIFQWFKENGIQLTEAERDEFIGATKQSFGRGQRGSGAITGEGELKIHTVPNQIADLGVTDHRRNFEARIMSAFKVHPLVIGLDSGMQYSAYNNLEVAERASWVKGIIPVMEIIESAITQQLLWQDYVADDKYKVEFDREMITALREDPRSQHERETIWNDRLKVGGITLAEYREELELEVKKEHDVFYLPTDHLPVKSDMMGSEELYEKLVGGGQDSEKQSPSGDNREVEGGKNRKGE